MTVVFKPFPDNLLFICIFNEFFPLCLLQHVVTDKRVLAMVKSAAAEADDEQGDDTAGVDQDVGLDFVSY